METKLERWTEEHYHEVKEYGSKLELANHLLHFIVLLYSLYGMIKFKVKFIRASQLVKRLSRFVLIHNWYLASKFLLIGLAIILLSLQQFDTSAPLKSYNCSLRQASALVYYNEHQSDKDTELNEVVFAAQHCTTLNTKFAFGIDRCPAAASHLLSFPQSLARAVGRHFGTDLFLMLSAFTGPFQVLGLRSALMYCFYAIALFIMMAIFPVELFYITVGFNYTRFVLNDASCLDDIYKKRAEILQRMRSWTQMSTSALTTGLTRNATKLRCLHIDSQIDVTSESRANEAKYASNFNSHIPDNTGQHSHLTISVSDSERNVAKNLFISNVSTEKTDVFMNTRKSINARTFFGDTKSHSEVNLNDSDSIYQSDNIQQFRRTGPIFNLSNHAREKKRKSLEHLNNLDFTERTNNNRGTLTKFWQVKDMEENSLNGVSKKSSTFNDWRYAQHVLLHAAAPKTNDSALNRPIRSIKSSRTFTIKKSHNTPTMTEQLHFDAKLSFDNIKFFKPYIRSEQWFKISLLQYPTFILQYTVTLAMLVVANHWYLKSVVEEEVSVCTSEVATELRKLSLLDIILDLEQYYSVFAISLSSSFYTSYYLSTKIELYIWLLEIEQQVNVSRVILELTNNCNQLLSRYHSDFNLLLHEMYDYHSIDYGDRYLTRHKKDESELNRKKSFISRNWIREKLCNEFGGLTSLVEYFKFRRQPYVLRLRCFELAGVELLGKRQTILRATYVNLNLFLHEMHDTRLMVTKIMRRTSVMCFAFAVVVSAARLQLATNTLNLKILFFSAMYVMNLYLISAAIINYKVSIASFFHND